MHLRLVLVLSPLYSIPKLRHVVDTLKKGWSATKTGVSRTTQKVARGSDGCGVAESMIGARQGWQGRRDRRRRAEREMGPVRSGLEDDRAGEEEAEGVPQPPQADHRRTERPCQRDCKHSREISFAVHVSVRVALVVRACACACGASGACAVRGMG
jgi:hypothetical protein